MDSDSPSDVPNPPPSEGTTPAAGGGSPFVENALVKGLIALVATSAGFAAFFAVLYFGIGGLIGALGLDNPWLPYAYQYILGGAVFFVGLFVIIRGRSANPVESTSDRFWIGILVFGLVWYALGHALWIDAALF